MLRNKLCFVTIMYTHQCNALHHVHGSVAMWSCPDKNFQQHPLFSLLFTIWCVYRSCGHLKTLLRGVRYTWISWTCNQTVGKRYALVTLAKYLLVFMKRGHCLIFFNKTILRIQRQMGKSRQSIGLAVEDTWRVLTSFLAYWWPEVMKAPFYKREFITVMVQVLLQLHTNILNRTQVKMDLCLHF